METISRCLSGGILGFDTHEREKKETELTKGEEGLKFSTKASSELMGTSGGQLAFLSHPELGQEGQPDFLLTSHVNFPG